MYACIYILYINVYMYIHVFTTRYDTTRYDTFRLVSSRSPDTPVTPESSETPETPEAYMDIYIYIYTYMYIYI